MERDFLGIHSKILHPDAAKGDAAGPSLQWPFSNKASAMQQFMLSKAASQEERPRNHVFPKHPSLRSQPLLMAPHPAFAPQNPYFKLNVHPYFKAQNPHNSAASSSSFVAARNKAKKNHRTAQLTVFYGGCVNVFDDVPSDKAQSIMSSLANRGPNPRAIPQARKASLARFLEKRKERLTSAMPYCSTKMSSENDSGGCNASSASNSSFAGHLKNSIKSISTELTI